MHELAVAEAIADTVRRRADGRRVARVDVRIGHLRQVVPDALQFSWELLAAGTELAGSVLAIEQVPAVVECHACFERTVLVVPILRCGRCEGSDVTLVSGEEFLIASFELTREAS